MEKLKVKKKQEIVDQETEKVSLKEKVEKLPEVLVSGSHDKKFYEMPWFWICLTIIVVCLTRPKKTIICGNGNGNGNGSGRGNTQ